MGPLDRLTISPDHIDPRPRGEQRHPRAQDWCCQHSGLGCPFPREKDALTKRLSDGPSPSFIYIYIIYILCAQLCALGEARDIKGFHKSPAGLKSEADQGSFGRARSMGNSTQFHHQLALIANSPVSSHHWLYFTIFSPRACESSLPSNDPMSPSLPGQVFLPSGRRGGGSRGCGRCAGSNL